jgi:hypothetical protein
MSHAQLLDQHGDVALTPQETGIQWSVCVHVPHLLRQGVMSHDRCTIYSLEWNELGNTGDILCYWSTTDFSSTINLEVDRFLELEQISCRK